ncbi:MAG: sigma 54-interacting transcriptional regulator, partial [Saprospiraceae bacterium]
INTGAIPSGTINSELFGHEKGAYTDAKSDRKGYFETVDGGTIFLDEIGEMPLDTQAFLLRVLESGEFIRVGSSKIVKTNVRVIAATNVNLLEKVKQGKFREDLYYRLNTVPITVPPLRERADDIYMLFRKFVLNFSDKYHSSPIQLDDKATLILQSYTWPGNIRELKNVAEKVSVMAEGNMVEADELLKIVPNLLDRNLPVIHSSENGRNGGDNFQEREILYKLLFEMKSDLNDLKGLIFKLVEDNDLSMPEIPSISGLLSSPKVDSPRPKPAFRDYRETEPSFEERKDFNNVQPMIIHNNENNHAYSETEEIEEELSLMEMEKRFITKALKKYKGKRKDAAEELGISERTLYRKIKEYDLTDKF